VGFRSFRRLGGCTFASCSLLLLLSRSTCTTLSVTQRGFPTSRRSRLAQGPPRSPLHCELFALPSMTKLTRDDSAQQWGFITGAGAVYEPVGTFPGDSSAPPPLVPIIRTPDDHSRRNKLLIGGGILTILIALWAIAHPKNERNSYAFTHRNGSNIDVFRDWTISAPDGSAQATFIGKLGSCCCCRVSPSQLEA
jgi:hypothetical protein